MKGGINRFVLHYIEYLTKFHVIRPLKSKRAAEVAHELLLILFLDLVTLHVLQSGNGKEVTSQEIHEL